VPIDGMTTRSASRQLRQTACIGAQVTEGDAVVRLEPEASH
jgi:hypothetical protein